MKSQLKKNYSYLKKKKQKKKVNESVNKLIRCRDPLYVILFIGTFICTTGDDDDTLGTKDFISNLTGMCSI